MRDFTGNEWTGRITNQFQEVVSPYEVVEAAERHGVLEWVARRKFKGLNRYITLSFEPTSSQPGFPPWGEFAFTVGADNGRQYGRYLIVRQPVFLAEPSEGSFWNWAPIAKERADSLTQAELTETYLPDSAEPRPPR